MCNIINFEREIQSEGSKPNIDFTPKLLDENLEKKDLRIFAAFLDENYVEPIYSN